AVRDAEERTAAMIAGGEVGVGTLRFVYRPLARDCDDGVELRSEFLEAIEIELRQLDGGDLFRAQHRAELLDRRVGIHRHHRFVDDENVKSGSSPFCSLNSRRRL